MCDTFAVLPAATGSGVMLFCKNSDREPNEAQAIERIPAGKHAQQWVQCTYIRIPQVEYTHEVLLSRPFQMWGAEMGVNEHGVAIGNEAVFTRIKMPAVNTGLTGMDLLRLALERTKTAEESLWCITELLKTYGQNACGGYENQKFFYHNSFIIADPTEAWVLETAGRHWVASRIKDTRSISNGLTIGAEYERVSEEAVNYAYRRGWLRDREPFDFQKAYSDWFMSRMSSCTFRQRLTSNRLKTLTGHFGVAEAAELLATHDPPGNAFEPHRSTTASICMHATGFTNPSQTTGSMMAEIRGNRLSTVWLTGTSMPCLSVYLPFFFGGTSLTGPTWKLPGAREDHSLWWQAEKLHRLVCRSYQKGRPLIEEERMAFQQQLWKEAAELTLRSASVDELDAFSRRALGDYRRLLDAWTSRLEDRSLKRRSRNPIYRIYKRRQDAKAGLKQPNNGNWLRVINTTNTDK